MRSRVDLPPPLGPSSAVSWPVGMLDRRRRRGRRSRRTLGDAGDLDAHRAPPLGRRDGQRDARSRCTATDDERRARTTTAYALGLLRSPRSARSTSSVAVCVWPRDVAGHDLDRAELAERAGEAEHDAVDERPRIVGSVIRRKRLHGVGAEAARRLLLVDALSSSTGTTSRITSGSDTNAVARIMPGMAKMISDAVVLERPAEPSVAAAVHEHEREAHDDRRDRDRQVDQGAEQPLAREPVARQQQRDADAEHGVDHHGGRRHHQGEAQRGQHDGSANASVSAVSPWANVVRTTSATGQATSSTR